MNYRDDFPDLIDDDWETKMWDLGHNVNSHINEMGPCNICKAICVVCMKEFRMRKNAKTAYTRSLCFKCRKAILDYQRKMINSHH